MSPPRNEYSAVAVAMDWATRITAVSLEMILPGIAGRWLDEWRGTKYWTLLGFGFGMVAGIWHLLVMTRALSAQQLHGKRRGDDSTDDEQ